VGNLDGTFGTGVIVSIKYQRLKKGRWPRLFDATPIIAGQERIVLEGMTSTGSTRPSNTVVFDLMRLLPDGDVGSTFGTAGELS